MSSKQFNKTIVIPAGENIDLEKSALKAVLRNSKESYHEFIEGESYSYDGNPKHRVQISFSLIFKYCKKHNLNCVGGTVKETGFDMCTVYKKESK